MTAWEDLRRLSLVVEGYELEGLELSTNSGYLRRTTLVRLTGAGDRRKRPRAVRRSP